MGFGWINRSDWGAYTDLNVETLAVIAGGEYASAKQWANIGRQAAELIAKKNWKMLYCGMGSGLAGLIAKKVLEKEGTVQAVVVEKAPPPDLPEKAEKILVPDFHERTRKLFDLADAFLVMPGGSGTLYEFAQLAAWHGAGLITRPVLLYDPDGWFKPIVEFYQQARKERVSGAPIKSMFRQVETINQVRFHLTKTL